MSYADEVIQGLKSIFEGFPEIPYACLFGSTLISNRPEGDIDILVGGHLDSDRRFYLMELIERRFNKKADIVVMDTRANEVCRKAFTKGKPIIVRDRDFFKRDALSTIWAYEDNWLVRKLREERVKKAFQNG